MNIMMFDKNVYYKLLDKKKLVGVLPEDKQLFHMNFISKSAKLSTKTEDLTDFDQVSIISISMKFV